jgi:hypothetical protein
VFRFVDHLVIVRGIDSILSSRIFLVFSGKHKAQPFDQEMNYEQHLPKQHALKIIEEKDVVPRHRKTRT